MRMIERRPRADAHQLLGRDADAAGADIVVEMGYRVMGHGEPLPSKCVAQRFSLSGAGWLETIAWARLGGGLAALRSPDAPPAKAACR